MPSMKTSFGNRYIYNNLLNEDDIQSLCEDTSLSRQWYDDLRALRDRGKPESSPGIQGGAENPLCNIWLGPILEKLGWHYPAQQQTIKWIGENNKIDFSLYEDKGGSRSLDSVPRAFLEAKKYGEKLEGGPYRQTMRYIRALMGQSGRGTVFGFLSNGKDWWYCASFGEGENIARCEIKLMDLLESEYTEESARALALFTRLFGRDYHQSGEAEKDGEARIGYIERVKEDVRYIITGLPFENIGNYFFAWLKRQRGGDFEPDAACLKDIYHHALTLAFRLIFQAYIEAKNPELLDTETHPTYKNYSLTHFCRQKMGWAKLRKNFETLDSGDKGEYMPVFNGGLFADKNTPWLAADNLFTDSEILEIAGGFLFKQTQEDPQPVPIDYASLRIKHFSEIYEELLQFEFRFARGKMYHIPAQKIAEKKGKKTDRNDFFADIEDWAKLKAENPDLAYTEIPSGSLYFTSKTLSRKASASYYTPESLTEFMCRTSVERALDQCARDGRSVLDLKILDNACGSGHFLTQALNILFEEVQSRNLLATDTRLQKQLEEDTARASQSLKEIRYKQPIESDTVLKRLLLKHCIYGVDMNSFAVEIARASLWLDTFIFGVPLAFIEHHVVTGNSLIGEIEQRKHEDTLFEDKDHFPQIQEIFGKINNISDMTGEQAKQSHELYESVRDDLLNASLICSKAIFGTFQNKIGKEARKKGSAIRLTDPFYQSNEGFVEWFKPFHYWLIFPELWDSENKRFKGFDIVIGNPPWDKVRFEEPAFFAQYHADYRRLDDTRKKETRERVLRLPGIRESHDLLKSFTDSQRAFMPDLFQLAHGSGGDQNLFRYFIERNLSLLAPQGILCYLTPSAWSYEQSSAKLRRHIWRHYHIYYFIQFENKGIFQNIDDRYKFACFMLKKTCEQQDSIPALFLQHDEFILKRLRDEGLEKLTLAYPTELIQNTDGEILLELKSEKDLSIIAKIHQNPELKTGLTKNYINFVRDFDMTNDVAKHVGEYFFDSPDGLENPRQLVEAKYFHQFNVNHQTKDFNHHPRFYDAELIKEYPKLKKRIQEQGYCDADYPRLAWRWIASNTNERTAIFCLLPPGSLAGNSSMISLGNQSLNSLIFIQGISNCLALDYLARQIIDINVTKSLVNTLPFPQPGEEELMDSPLCRRVIEISALLSLGHAQGTPKQEDMDFLKDFLLEHDFYHNEQELLKNIPDTEDKRLRLQAELDVLAARDIYGLSLEDMKHIIPNYFPQWEKEQAFHVNLVYGLWDEKLIK